VTVVQTCALPISIVLKNDGTVLINGRVIE